jgi:hypothetical protein
MAPVQNDGYGRVWDSSTTIELLALILAIPGAIVALATLCIVLRQWNLNVQGQWYFCELREILPLFKVCTHRDCCSIHAQISWAIVPTAAATEHRKLFGQEQHRSDQLVSTPVSGATRRNVVRAPTMGGRDHSIFS